MAEQFTHDGLARDLAGQLRSPKTLVWENMQMGSSGSCRPDVFQIRKSFSDPRPTSYEVKVSVSDFRGDVNAGKWEKYLEFSQCVIFAVQKGLITKDDIPPGAGLIVRTDKVWRLTKKPTLTSWEWSPDVCVKLLIDGVDRYHEQKKHILAAQASDFIARKTALKKIGKEIGSDISEYLENKGIVRYTLEQAERIKKDAEQEQEQWRRDLAKALRIDVPDDNTFQFSIRHKLNKRIELLKNGDEFTALKRKIDHFERATAGLNAAMAAIQDDFFVKDRS